MLVRGYNFTFVVFAQIQQHLIKYVNLLISVLFLSSRCHIENGPDGAWTGAPNTAMESGQGFNFTSEIWTHAVKYDPPTPPGYLLMTF